MLLAVSSEAIAARIFSRRSFPALPPPVALPVNAEVEEEVEGGDERPFSSAEPLAVRVGGTGSGEAFREEEGVVFSLFALSASLLPARGDASNRGVDKPTLTA